MNLLLKTNENRSMDDLLKIVQDKSYECFRENAFFEVQYILISLATETIKNSKDINCFFKNNYKHLNFDDFEKYNGLMPYLKEVLYNEKISPKYSFEDDGIIVDVRLKNIDAIFDDFSYTERKNLTWLTNNTHLSSQRHFGTLIDYISKRIQNNNDIFVFLEERYQFKINDVFKLMLNENNELYKGD